MNGLNRRLGTCSDNRFFLEKSQRSSRVNHEKKKSNGMRQATAINKARLDCVKR